MFRGRSVVEIMVLIFTLLVAFSILATGAIVSIIEIKDPTVDTTSIVDTLTTIIGTIIGALMGLLAGRSENVNNTLEQRIDRHETRHTEREEMES